MRVGCRCTFQQDDNLEHTTTAAMEWFGSKHIHVLKWSCRILNLIALTNPWQALENEGLITKRRKGMLCGVVVSVSTPCTGASVFNRVVMSLSPILVDLLPHVYPFYSICHQIEATMSTKNLKAN